MIRIKPPQFPPPPSGLFNISLLVLRLVAGTAFMFHGWSKIQNPFGWMGADSGTPAIFQALAALSEFGGGLAWVIGLLTPLAAAGIFSTMCVAWWKHAVVQGAPFVGKPPSYELALLYAAIAVLFMLCGPGRLSVDWLIARRRISTNERE